MQTPTVRCAACQGKGYRKLSKPLLRTLRAIVNNPKPISIPEIAAKLGEKIDATAINKRVNALVRMKLAVVLKSKGVRRFAGRVV